jgi:hypothetical protein
MFLQKYTHFWKRNDLGGGLSCWSHTLRIWRLWDGFMSSGFQPSRLMPYIGQIILRFVNDTWIHIYLVKKLWYSWNSEFELLYCTYNRTAAYCYTHLQHITCIAFGVAIGLIKMVFICARKTAGHVCDDSLFRVLYSDSCPTWNSGQSWVSFWCPVLCPLSLVRGKSHVII